MAILTREQLLGPVTPEITEHYVEKLGGEVCLRPLSIADREKCEKAKTAGAADLPLMALFVSLSLCEPDGQLVCRDKNDLQQFKQNYAAVLPDIFGEVLKLNGFATEPEPETGND